MKLFSGNITPKKHITHEKGENSWKNIFLGVQWPQITSKTYGDHYDKLECEIKQKWPIELSKP